MSDFDESRRCLEFFRLLGQLKELKRAGWIKNNVMLPESDADHMYRMAMLVFPLKTSFELNGEIFSLDKDKLIKMCLVHDVAEAIVGDITPSCPISKDEKHQP